LAIRSQLDQLQGVTSRAFDAAGNQSAVLTSVSVLVVVGGLVTGLLVFGPVMAYFLRRKFLKTQEL
jgi:hypothetical protein